MQHNLHFWLNKRCLRRVSQTVLFFFIFNIMFLNLTVLPGLNRYINTPVALAAVADRDGLGLESFWSYFNKDLGDGWSYSVNTHTGNLVIQKEIINISGRGAGLQEGIVYNSSSNQQGLVGTGWKLSNDMFLQENADASVTLKDQDATNHLFTRNGDGSYTAPEGVNLKLTKIAEGVFDLKDLNNTVLQFQNNYLVSITDEKGNMTEFFYDSNNQLIHFNDASFRNVNYSYDATNGKLKTITDPASRTINFGYDPYGQLTSISDPKGGATLFGYDPSGRLASLTDSNGNKTSFFYNADGKVSKVNDARTNISKEYSTLFTYDTTLLKTTITDPSNKTVTFTHNTGGNLTQIQDGAGNIISYTWNNNDLTEMDDAKGSTSAAYDSNGNLTQITDTISDTTNATTNITYDTKNNPDLVTKANNNQVKNSYDTESNLISSANPVRKEADANTYDAYGNLTSATRVGAPTYNLLANGNFEQVDSYGKAKNWVYGGTTSLISVDSTTSTYGKKSLKMRSTTKAGAYAYQDISVSAGQKLTLTTSYRIDNLASGGGILIGLEYYDANWNFLSSKYSNAMSGSGDGELVLTHEVPTGAVYASAVVEFWNTSGTAWFDGVQLEKSIAANEGHIKTEFDYTENSSFENGLNYWFTGGSGTVTNTSEAAWGGSKSVKISGGFAYVGSSYIPVRAQESLTVSGLIKTVNVNGYGAYFQANFYDSSYNYLSSHVLDQQQGTQEFTRSAKAVTVPSTAAYVVLFGVLDATSGTAYFDNIKLTPAATTSMVYDNAGNYVTDLYDPLNNWTNYAYDSAGNPTQISDPKGNVTRFGYDALNNLTSVTDALNKVFRFGYDPVSNQVAYRDGRSTSETDDTYKTVFGYDKLNNLTSITDPLNRQESYGYDDSGNLTSVNHPNGKEVQFSYDEANRLKQKKYTFESNQYDLSYDGANNLTQVTDNLSRSYTYGYDKANRLKTITDLFGYGQEFYMDNVGNITSVTDSKGKTISYGYGSSDQLLSLTDTFGKKTEFRYDEAGRPFQIIKGNGLFSYNSYDRAGRIIKITDPGLPGGYAISYLYDANGNITSTNVLNGIYTFGYDGLNRLTSWRDEYNNVTAYEYDAVGNLTKKGSRTFTYNAANEITNAGFSYDTNGNLTSDGNFNYHYDSENHLVKVTKVSDGSTTATYEYDYRGLRISKTTSGGTVRYHWDNNERMVRESDTSGNTLAQYIYDDKGQLTAIEKGGAIYYTHTNQRGDILSITDANKNQVATYKYGPWGELLSSTGTFSQPFRYAGYYYDSETGLYFLKARYYSPELGRFLTKDTFKGLNEDPQTLNLYAYAKGNPVIYVDPTGHSSWITTAAGWVGLFLSISSVILGSGPVATYLAAAGFTISVATFGYSAYNVWKRKGYSPLTTRFWQEVWVDVLGLTPGKVGKLVNWSLGRAMLYKDTIESLTRKDKKKKK